MQLWHIHAITSLQIFCCSAAYLSGSAAQIFVGIIANPKNKPCRGEPRRARRSQIFVNVLPIAMFKQLENLFPDTNDKFNKNHFSILIFEHRFYNNIQLTTPEMVFSICFKWKYNTCLLTNDMPDFATRV